MSDPQPAQHEWFATPDPAKPDVYDGLGLRFSCTMCGNCCSGPEGFVLVSDDELAALAKRFGLTNEQFAAQYTRSTTEGRSLVERKTEHGMDCVFLDRATIPGKAICGVYEDRPKQCRTWPFWESVLKSRATWERAKRICPGIDTGKHHDLVQIRVQRSVIKI